MNNVEVLLASAGMTKAHLVKLNYYLRRPADASTLGITIARFSPGRSRKRSARCTGMRVLLCRLWAVDN